MQKNSLQSYGQSIWESYYILVDIWPHVETGQHDDQNEMMYGNIFLMFNTMRNIYSIWMN